MITMFQRLCLDIFGMLDYLMTPLSPPSGDFHMALDHWMGTFTTNPEVCQHLFDACILVWFVWSESTVPFDINVHKNVEVTRPTDIVTEKEEFNISQVFKWERLRYHGGYSQHVRSQIGPSIGIEQFAAPFVDDDTAVTTNNSTSAPKEATSMGAGVSRTQRSTSRQEPCGCSTTIHFTVY